jgi:hypothetical protein
MEDSQMGGNKLITKQKKQNKETETKENLTGTK